MVSEAEFDKNQKAFREAMAQQSTTATAQSGTTMPSDQPSGTFFQDLTGINIGQGLMNESPEIRAEGFNSAAGVVGVGAKAAKAVNAAAPARTAIAAAAREAYAAAIKKGATKSAAAQAARVAAAKASADASFMAGNYLTWAGKKLASIGVRKAVVGAIGLGVSIFFLDVIRGMLTDKNAGALTLQGWLVDGVVDENEYRTELDKLDLGDQKEFYIEAALAAREEKLLQDMEKEFQIAIVPPEFRTVLGESPEQRAQAFRQEQARLAQPANAQGLTVAQVEQIQREFETGARSSAITEQLKNRAILTQEEIDQLPPGQLTPELMERLLEKKTPNKAEEPVAAAAPAPKPKSSLPTPGEQAAGASFVGGFTPGCPPGFIYDAGLKRCVPDTGVSRR